MKPAKAVDARTPCARAAEATLGGMTAAGWTHVSQHIPGLEGHGVLFADHEDYDDIGLALMGAGFAVRVIDGRGVTTRREVFSAVADALGLPDTAHDHLDALADSLQDLSHFCPGHQRLVLLWRNAEHLLDADPELWEEVADVLRESSAMLWTGHDETEDMIFETIAFLVGYDVYPLRLGVVEEAGGSI